MRMGRSWGEASVLRVKKVTAGISPRVDTNLLPALTSTTTFSIKMSGHEIEAIPHAGIDLEPDRAIDLLYDEIRPLLAVASYLNGQPINLVDANPHWIDTDDEDQRL